MKALLQPILDLFYPRICQACGTLLAAEQHSICALCAYYLPKTDFVHLRENAFTRRFWGRFPLQSACALYYFRQGGRTQALIHALKYKKQPSVGTLCGEWLGAAMHSAAHYQDIDAIIPVPLHPDKLRRRGYNQSEEFAKGLATALAVPVWTDVLLRVENTDSQTRKSKLARLQNTRAVFTLHKADQLTGKHILLVDDVMTTGATLEACALTLLQAQAVRLSLATIAFATQEIT